MGKLCLKYLKMDKFLFFFDLRIGVILMGVIGSFMSACFIAFFLVSLLAAKRLGLQDHQYYCALYCLIFFSASFFMHLLTFLGVVVKSEAFLLPFLYCGGIWLVLNVIFIGVLYFCFRIEIGRCSGLEYGFQGKVLKVETVLE